jgi:hypothetical protein
MEAEGNKRLIFILALGIYDEVPGQFGEWNNATIGDDLKPFRRAADAIEASGLSYTLVRPAWLTDEDEVVYELTQRDEPFKGTVVSHKCVADLIVRVIRSPDLYVGANLGVNKPDSDGDKRTSCEPRYRLFALSAYANIHPLLKGLLWVEAVSKRERAAPWSNLISCIPQYAAESPVHERELVKIVHRG